MMRGEIAFALRRIRHRPAHALAVALTLGLGLGASIAVFGAVDAILLRPLPFAEAGRLISITQRIPVTGLPELTISDIGYRRIAQDTRTLSGAAAYNTRAANLVRAVGTERLVIARATANVFSVLRVRPLLGRAFTAEDDVPNGPRVLVLSNGLWRTMFNADSSVVGQSVNIEGAPYTIVGVLDANVVFPSRDVSAWEPLQLDPSAANPFQNSYSVIGRLRPGVTLDQARRDLTEPIRAVGREYPGPHPGTALDPAGYGANVRPLAATVVGDARAVVTLLVGGAMALLILTCANVVNLQLASVIVRGEEIAVRTALGATRWRLIRGAIVEGVLLATLGALVGLIAMSIGARLIVAILPTGVAIQSSALSVTTLGVTALAVLAIGAVVGAVPTFVFTRRSPADALRDRGGVSTAVGMRRALSSAQVALAVVLLHGSGLLLVSAARVQEVDLGFRTEGTLSVRINIPDATLRDRTARETLLRRFLGEIAALPGVTEVGLANTLPLTLGPRDMGMAVEGRPFKADGTDPIADFRLVSGGYFATMGIVATRGRTFTDDDATERVTPVVINETLARQLFGDREDPIGQRLKFGPVAPWMPIVAVVSDAKNRALTDPPRPELYLPALGSWASFSLRSGMSIVARTPGDAMRLASPIRTAIRSSAPDVAIARIVSLGEIVRDAQVRSVTATRLISWYAAAALLIAMSGTYAVLAYLINQRRRELAVRRALGAPARAMVGLVARESATLIGLGVLVGVVGTAASRRLLSGLIYGVGSLDVGVLGLVVSMAIAAGVVAAIVPIQRALGADPCEALRSSP
jgi:putative ABC transport system permease protein